MMVKSAKISAVIVLLITIFFADGTITRIFAKRAKSWKEELQSLSKDGGIMAIAENGDILVNIRGAEPLIPASLTKLATAALALRTLGPLFRFKTEFFLCPDSDLVIKGRGDPMLISEVWNEIAERLSKKLPGGIRKIIIDDTFFAEGLKVPGNDDSRNPYNSPPSAVAANFNTIFVTVLPDGNVLSAEPQTPLTEFARKVATILKIDGTERVSIGAQSSLDYRLYAGHLLKSFLRIKGVKVRSSVVHGRLPAGAEQIMEFESPFTLVEILTGMMRYSTNFTANQLFLYIGARIFGPPADFEKGSRAINVFFKEIGIKDAVVLEGSGICHGNRLSAEDTVKILMWLAPYRDILPVKNSMLIKTGTLKEVKSAAGYFISDKNGLVSFAVILNHCGNRGRLWKILRLLKNHL